MDLIEVVVLLSALLCSLVAGLVFTFAVVVMPGIRTLTDRDFLQSFKAMDRVIQNKQPLFIMVWLGSAVLVLASALLSIWRWEGPDRMLSIVACAIYLFGVQAPTIAINVPLNNELQSQDLDTMTAAELRETRARFEPRWLRWNAIRTVLAILATALWLVLLARL